MFHSSFQRRRYRRTTAKSSFEFSVHSTKTQILTPIEKGPEPSKQQKVLIEQKKKVLEREREKKKFMKKKIEVSG